MLEKYLIVEDIFIEDLERRLNNENIKLIELNFEDNIINVEFELTSSEEEYVEYIRSRVLFITIRIINKYFNVFGQAIDDLYYFDKINENIIKIELF